MKELPTDLQNYSGDFIPGLEYKNLSKDILVKLLGEYARLLVMIDGIWNSIVAREVSPEKASEWETEVWKRQYGLELPRIAKILDIKGDDVLTVFKLLQFTPDGYATGGQWVAKIDIKNRNEVIFSITRCATLEYFERHGEEDNIRGICREGGLEDKAMEWYAKFINPDIKIRRLKTPPRKSPDEIPCQWEFKLKV